MPARVADRAGGGDALAEELRERTAELEQQVEESRMLAEELEATNLDLIRAMAEAEQARAEVAQAAARLRAVHAASPDGFCLFGAVRDERGAIVDFAYLEVNPAAERLIGHDAAALRATTLGMRSPSAHGQGLIEAYARVCESGEPFRAELHYAGDGYDGWFRIEAVRVATGEVAVVFSDVTERRKRELADRFLARSSDALASSLDYEETLRMIARSAVPELADWCTVDLLAEPEPLAGPRRWPPQVEKVARAHDDPERLAWGLELERRVPRDWNAPTGLARVLREATCEFHPVITDDTYVATARNAEELALLREIGYSAFLCVPLVARDRLLGALTLCMTDSGRNYDEADLALARDLARRCATAIDHARLYREAEAAREAAEAANRAKSEFLGTMSHELRTPLNAIAGYVELLELGVRGPLAPRQVEDLGRIRRSTQMLTALVNDVLNFARLEAGQVQFHPAAVRLGEVLADLDTMLTPQFRERRIRFEHHECSPDVVVVADGERLRQILMNLLANAAKFTEPGGQVVLCCHLPEGEGTVRITVQDTGRGIPADQLERIFEPFVQVDRHLLHESQQGVGLGLSIARDLARRMGGDLMAASTPGQGSAFTLVLPRGPRDYGGGGASPPVVGAAGA